MTTHKLGPNDRCHCGSSKKYKRCHQALDSRQAAQAKPKMSSKPQAMPARRELLGIVSYLTYSEAYGRPFSAQVLREYVRSFSWDGLFIRLSCLAGAIANDETPNSYSNNIEQALRQLASGPVVAMRKVGRYAQANPDRPLVHEQAVYFLQAMAILDGAESGKAPTEHQLAVLMLMANDYLGDWKQRDESGLSKLEALMAAFCHVARFNKQPDVLRELVRAEVVFTRRPETGALADKSLWPELEKEAFFGKDFSDYFASFVLPLYFLSVQWGTRDTGGKVVAPILHPAQWMEQTCLRKDDAAPAFAALTIDREAARKALVASVRKDGLPHSPALFVSTPFLRLPDGNVVASSPWMVREHLRGGLWMRLKTQVQAKFGNGEDWMRAFGQMFELACREVSKLAAEEPGFTGKLSLSAEVGTADELEDVVILDGNSAALFSAKSRLVRQSIARDADSKAAVVKWYDDFLFEAPKGSRRAGALRLLDAKIKKIRAGEAAGVQRDARLFPILVTFDDLCENMALNRWVDERCKALGVLQGKDVAAPLLITLEGLESLLSIASKGQSLMALLAEKAKPENRDRTIHQFLANFDLTGEKLRLPSLAARFNQLTEQTQKALFEKRKNIEAP